jgi:hypothetical protein
MWSASSPRWTVLGPANDVLGAAEFPAGFSFLAASDSHVWGTQVAPDERVTMVRFGVTSGTVSKLPRVRATVRTQV